MYIFGKNQHLFVPGILTKQLQNLIYKKRSANFASPFSIDSLFYKIPSIINIKTDQPEAI